jgi:ribosome-binding protein aMBF1 (putative translation factor)
LIKQKSRSIMSEHMKKRLNKKKSTATITIMDKRYIIPEKSVKAILTLILSNPYVKEDSIPYNEIVSEKIKKIGKAAMALKGLRSREDLTQKQLAEKLGIDQAIISKIENGRIKIERDVAKRLGKIFNINHNVFLT